LIYGVLEEAYPLKESQQSTVQAIY